MKMMIILYAVLWSVSSCVCADLSTKIEGVFERPKSQKVLVQLWENYQDCRSVYWDVQGLKAMDECGTIWNALFEAFTLGLADDNHLSTESFSDRKVDQIFERLAVYLGKEEHIEYGDMADKRRLTSDQNQELLLVGEARRWCVKKGAGSGADQGTLRIFIPGLSMRLEGYRAASTDC